jgi:hypothetical protein
MSNRYDKRSLVWVMPYTGATVKYGFQTNMPLADGALLGHNDIEGTYPAGLVIGANQPKPPRATKLKTTGSSSSYCGSNAVAAAKAQGWSVQPGRFKIGASSARSKCVKIVTGGISYAWNMPAETYANIPAAERTALGIADATNADEDLVFGASYPRMPRVFKIISSTGGGFNRVSTFCDQTKLDSLPTGWQTLRATRTRL